MIVFFFRADPAMFRVVLGEHDRSTISGNEVTKYISRIIVVSAIPYYLIDNTCFLSIGYERFAC